MPAPLVEGVRHRPPRGAAHVGSPTKAMQVIVYSSRAGKRRGCIPWPL